jgi:hypothetical protein
VKSLRALPARPATGIDSFAMISDPAPKQATPSTPVRSLLASIVLELPANFDSMEPEEQQATLMAAIGRKWIADQKAGNNPPIEG